MDKKSIFGIIIVGIIILGILGSCVGESEYEKAGDEFGTWIKEDPKSWSDTEKQYFNDLMDWADKN